MAMLITRLLSRIVSPVVIVFMVTCGCHDLVAQPHRQALPRPPADAIDPQLLTPAIHTSIRNGLATLLARQAAEGNPTGLVHPPVPREVRMVSVRYTWKEVEEPVFREEREERLVPKHDEYGNPQGFEKRSVVVRRVVTGTQRVRRLVRDPQGEVERQQRQIVYGEGEQAWVPRGLVGLNGQALYVFCKAGHAQQPYTRLLANDLVQLIDQIGLPDYTWDLAWLAIGLIALNDPEHRELTQHVLGRLIDGQIRDRGDAQGLWGPLAIHYPMLARGLEAEIALANEIQQLQQQMDRLPASRQAQSQATIQRLTAQQHELQRLMNDVSQQGRRLLHVTQRYALSEQWAMPGLPYDIYNYVVVDLDSTASAALALDEARRRGVLPAQTHRVQIGRRTLAPPEQTQATITSAIQAVIRWQQAHGGWHATNLLEFNRAFTPGAIGRRDISVNGKMPALLSPESLRSNLAGGAALVHLARATPMRHPQARAAFDRAESHLLACVEAWLDAAPDTPRRRVLYRGDVDRYEDLVGNRGQIPVKPWQLTPPKDLPFGHVTTPYDLLPGIVGLLRDWEDTQEPSLRYPKLFNEVALRLLLLQQQTGQWPDEGRQASTSSGLMADTLRETAWGIVESVLVRSRPQRDLNRWSMLVGSQVAESTGSPTGLYATLNALTLLLEGAPGVIDMTDAIVLPEASEGQPSDEGVAATEPAGPMMPDDAVAGAVRANPALEPLLTALGAGASPSAR